MALIEMGGTADLAAIYAGVARIYPEWPEHYKDEQSFRATIRRTIQRYCPQAASFDPANAAMFEQVDRGRYRIVAPSSRAAVRDRGRRL